MSKKKPFAGKECPSISKVRKSAIFKHAMLEISYRIVSAACDGC